MEDWTVDISGMEEEELAPEAEDVKEEGEFMLRHLDDTFSGFLQKVRVSVSLGGICNSHALDAETNRDVGKLFNVAVRGNGKEPKFVRIKSQHFQRTLAHGAGGSQ